MKKVLIDIPVLDSIVETIQLKQPQPDANQMDLLVYSQRELYQTYYLADALAKSQFPDRVTQMLRNIGSIELFISDELMANPLVKTLIELSKVSEQYLPTLTPDIENLTLPKPFQASRYDTAILLTFILENKIDYYFTNNALFKLDWLYIRHVLKMYDPIMNLKMKING